MILNMSQGGKAPKEILEAQTITPGTSDTVLNKDSYLNGDITIPGDADLLPENIRTGVEIFGVTGNVNSAEYGIIYNAVNADGYPTDATFKIAHSLKHGTTIDEFGPAYDYLEKVEIICDTLKTEQFKDVGNTTNAVDKKIKIKCKTVENKALYEAFGQNTCTVNFWISNICETIDAAGAWGNSPFAYCGDKNNVFYCEPETKPDAWGTNWNTNYSGKASTTYYGITEAAFDAL